MLKGAAVNGFAVVVGGGGASKIRSCLRLWDFHHLASSDAWKSSPTAKSFDSQTRTRYHQGERLGGFFGSFQEVRARGDQLRRYRGRPHGDRIFPPASPGTCRVKLTDVWVFHVGTVHAHVLRERNRPGHDDEHVSTDIMIIKVPSVTSKYRGPVSHVP